MNSDVTEFELTLIILASILTIVFILSIVGRWLNFEIFSHFRRKRKLLKDLSLTENSEPIGSLIDLNVFTDSMKKQEENRVFTSRIDSISSLITNEMNNEDSNLIRSDDENLLKTTIKRTISCDSNQFVPLISSLDEENRRQGKLKLTINYKQLEQTLEVNFLQIRDLSIDEKQRNISHLFLTVWLDQDEKFSQQSQLINYETNRSLIFDSFIQWKVNEDRLPSTVLNADLYGRTRNSNKQILFGRSSFTFGQIFIFQPLTTWLNFYPADQICDYLGEINVSLCYHPTADRLTCSLIQARNLIFNSRETSIDCYATISLLNQRQIVKKTRTNNYRLTDRNPIFNETSVFHLSTTDLLTAYILIVIFQIIPSSSKTTNDVQIGQCLIGNHQNSQPTSHWQQMLRVLRRPVVLWHPLKL